jgi:hypothetical protein
MPSLDAATIGPGSVWEGGVEPDVTWGSGGIDDWGWTSIACAGVEPGPGGICASRLVFPAVAVSGASVPIFPGGPA